MQEALRCNECHLPNGAHALGCSQMTVEYLRTIYHSKAMLAELRTQRIKQLKKDVAAWQGKYRIVKHENNQLRAKLYKSNQIPSRGQRGGNGSM